MAVTSVTELPDCDGEQNNTYQRTYTRTFRVICDSRNDGPRTAREASGIPSIGNTYSRGNESDSGAFVQSVKARCESAGANPDHSQWVVTVAYGPYNSNVFPSNPVSWPVLVSFGSQKFERVVVRDVNGDPIRNSAKDPYSEPVTVDDSRPILTVVRNELVSSYDDTVAGQYRDKVNLNAWNNCAVKTVKCSSITTSQQQYDSVNDMWYFQVTYVFEYNPDGWKKKLLDQGFAELDGSSPPKQKLIKGPDGQPLNEPCLLDGSGAKLASNGTPVFTDWEVYTAVDFSGLNIDLSTALGRV